MIKLEIIEKIIQLTICTGYLQNTRPLSLMIIASKESAKTETTTQFAQNDGILLMNNFTPTSFMENYILKFGSGEYRHLIIPDLLSCINRQKYLVDTTITFLNAFMEEGVKEIASKAFEGGTIKLDRPVRGGVITTIAKEDFEDRWKRWSSVGFLTRWLPVSYEYTQEIVEEILYAVATEDESRILGTPIKLDLPKARVKVTIPKELSAVLIEPGKEMQSRLSTYGFRGVRHLRRLVQAQALISGRHEVISEDIEEILKLAEFCNMDYKTI